MDVQQFEEASDGCITFRHLLPHHTPYTQIFSKETEHFAGETLLAKQEIIKSLAELVSSIKSLCPLVLMIILVSCGEMELP